MSRILARDCTFKMIFQYLYNKDFDMQLLCDEFSLEESEFDFAHKSFLSVKDNFEVIEEKILKSLKSNMTIKDIFKLDYALLIYAISQIDYMLEPKGLVINETVEMAKKYSTEKSPKFINGFLSSIYNGSDN